MRAAVLTVLWLAACDIGARSPVPPQPEPAAAPVALVMVILTHEMWVGNSSYEQEEAARYDGVFPSLRIVFEETPPASLLPSGSIGAVIGYSTGTRVLLRMGPIERVTSALFANERRFHNQIGKDLVFGIERGLRALQRVRADRKILLVIGDGDDTDREAARPKLVALARWATAIAAEVVVLRWHTHCSSVVQDIFPLECHATREGVEQVLRTLLR